MGVEVLCFPPNEGVRVHDLTSLHQNGQQHEREGDETASSDEIRHGAHKSGSKPGLWDKTRLTLERYGSDFTLFLDYQTVFSLAFALCSLAPQQDFIFTSSTVTFFESVATLSMLPSLSPPPDHRNPYPASQICHSC